MPSGLVNRSLELVAGRLPVLKRIPVFKLLSVAEIALLTRDHVQKLTPAQRRRLLALVREGRGRSGRLTEAEAAELHALVDKLQPRRLVGGTVDRLSPVPLPKRILYGKRR